MHTWNLKELGGIASRSQLAAAGAWPPELTRAVRDGTLVRVRRGLYALPNARGPALDAARRGGRLSCVSAARTYGWWGGMDARTHLRVPPTAHLTEPRSPSCVVHWAESQPCRDVWRVSKADCLRSVVRCADQETAIAVLDTALSDGAVRMHDLVEIFAGEPSRSRATALLARPGSDSGVESIARQRLTAAGYTVEQQIPVPGVGRVDLRVDGWLFIELDGFEYHRDRDAFERDRARDLGLAVLGAGRLRFSAKQVLSEWDSVLDGIRAVVRQEMSRDTPMARPFGRRTQRKAAGFPFERSAEGRGAGPPFERKEDQPHEPQTMLSRRWPEETVSPTAALIPATVPSL
ncbi:type IV toxin-antitoxin system AbiEi family antitoxin domain-containing protein [Leifsonia sp. PS1209]|uniref:type IV toxin-antitoxin system AbiEi family antitoxin domain-containing protein n=1 Tax=Leifsonia sp. PS1209 TaxID=2724914 RepID=UPI001442C484|nr:type IV toxin-antitoxin system AbiEi family antitoxin domain-containing protein [Leifsonia sp. PS1209]QIZ97933.1 DUF559 domain-containing protein [Leifsonia sp. PS1209]